MTDEDRLKVFVEAARLDLAKRGMNGDIESLNVQIMEVIGTAMIKLLNAEYKDRGFT